MAKKQDATNATIADVLAGEQTIQTEVVALQTAAGQLVTLSVNESNTIAQLQAQIAALTAAGGISPADQAKLNQIIADFTTINTNLQATATQVQGALPPPAPAPAPTA